jgi:hypothetical protein
MAAVEADDELELSWTARHSPGALWLKLTTANVSLPTVRRRRSVAERRSRPSRPFPLSPCLRLVCCARRLHGQARALQVTLHRASPALLRS